MSSTCFQSILVRRLLMCCIRSTIATPINIILLSLFVILVYYRLRPSPPATLPQGPAPIVFRTFSPLTLLKYNGEKGQPVYLAVKTKVYDVTPGRNFYGPGGPYENFAGRDATRGLACQSFDEEMLTKDLEGALDDCSDLDAEQLENLNGWVERFDEKVGLHIIELLTYRPLTCMPVPCGWKIGGI
jgi:membrane-associated progesterone receptor component